MSKYTRAVTLPETVRETYTEITISDFVSVSVLGTEKGIVDYLLKKYDEQECIPVGCIPAAH